MKKIFLIAAFLVGLLVSEANAQYPRRFNSVGYAPVIVWVPYGSYMNTGVIISPDRRYVRIGVNTGFSGITRVDTFNYYTGRANRTLFP